VDRNWIPQEPGTVPQRAGGHTRLMGIDFDWWRQLTADHLIGEVQGGYPPSPDMRAIKGLRRHDAFYARS
jgi:hypothetical protein